MITLIGERVEVKGNINPEVKFPEPQPSPQFQGTFGKLNTSPNKPNLSSLKKKDFDPFFDKHVKKVTLIDDEQDIDSELDPVTRNIIKRFLERMLDFKYKNLKLDDILTEGEIVDMVEEIGQVIGEMYGIAEIALEMNNK
ncbi:MAG: hypothetical protein KatS3mg002_0331 [Candidatus Woesearchaeota archaeon]|nr:MAG: hypothetical protein KatS3mg002_0331 [Candidatus Woesearchaeota archaeon]